MSATQSTLKPKRENLAVRNGCEHGSVFAIVFSGSVVINEDLTVAQSRRPPEKGFNEKQTELCLPRADIRAGSMAGAEGNI